MLFVEQLTAGPVWVFRRGFCLGAWEGCIRAAAYKGEVPGCDVLFQRLQVRMFDADDGQRSQELCTGGISSLVARLVHGQPPF
jgi:hypothetical protein